MPAPIKLNASKVRTAKKAGGHKVNAVVKPLAVSAVSAKNITKFRIK